MRTANAIAVAVAAAVVLVACCRSNGQKAFQPLRVYYVPIGAETLTAVTSANIEHRGARFEIQSAKDICAIMKVLDAATRPAPQKFTDMAVRVKLLEVTDKGDKLLALIENDGLVMFPAGEDGVIPSRGMNTLKKVIEAQFK